MRKGATLEKAILQLFKYYRQKGFYCQQNFPRVLQDGRTVERHGFDFLIYNGLFYAFDAKETSGKVWYLANAKPHQLDALTSIKRNGGQAFFLVLFKQTKQIVMYDIDIVLRAISNNYSSLTPEMGEKTKLDFMEGISQ